MTEIMTNTVASRLLELPSPLVCLILEFVDYEPAIFSIRHPGTFRFLEKWYRHKVLEHPFVKFNTSIPETSGDDCVQTAIRYARVYRLLSGRDGRPNTCIFCDMIAINYVYVERVLYRTCYECISAKPVLKKGFVVLDCYDCHDLTVVRSDRKSTPGCYGCLSFTSLRRKIGVATE